MAVPVLSLTAGSEFGVTVVAIHGMHRMTTTRLHGASVREAEARLLIIVLAAAWNITSNADDANTAAESQVVKVLVQGCFAEGHGREVLFRSANGEFVHTSRSKDVALRVM